MSNQLIINKNIRKYLDFGFTNYQNAIKIHGSESKEHFIAKCSLCFDFKRQGRIFITEAKLKGTKFIPDVLLIDCEPMEAYEIMKSEKDESIEKKAEKYDGIRIFPIKI